MAIFSLRYSRPTAERRRDGTVRYSHHGLCFGARTQERYDQLVKELTEYLKRQYTRHIDGQLCEVKVNHVVTIDGSLDVAR